MILGWALRAKGDHAGAERQYRRALAIDQRVYGPQDPQTQSDAQILEEFLRESHKSPPRANRR